MHQDLYRIDDILLRAGRFTAVLVVLAAALLAVLGPSQGPSGLLKEYAPILVLAALCPVALLWAGTKMRRRERCTAAIWNLLRQNAELHVPELLAHSDFSLQDLQQAVVFLNNRGLGYYVWNERGDAIQDGRLSTVQIHVEKCDLCGASISLEVPLGFREVPRCPYCSDPVSVDSLAQRRQEALESLRAEHSTAVATLARPTAASPKAASQTIVSAIKAEPSPNQVPFSIPLFLILMVAFWPAGLAYAWYRWQKSRSA